MNQLTDMKIDSLSEHDLPVHYRFTDSVRSDGLYLVESKWYPVRETECCYYLVDEHSKRMLNVGNNWFGRPQKRVIKGALRSFAHPDRDMAFQSYLARKRSQAWHAKVGQQTANVALGAYPERSPSAPDTVNGQLKLGAPQFISELVFD
ncbi:hypothetical protein [Ferrimonas aestuarii]|uniref:Uncharacterized protein n=1 Tax=Ferrimonas aestuarii TaxID=2569539 RepID=A0A4U1BL82_9GAMM|nr:hypothetical protein [Ferrimonas aestuarii]TKB53278.1 hypothetical protein FCL42_14495 [Ferrimonas aestuarii]